MYSILDKILLQVSCRRTSTSEAVVWVGQMYFDGLKLFVILRNAVVLTSQAQFEG